MTSLAYRYLFDDTDVTDWASFDDTYNYADSLKSGVFNQLMKIDSMVVPYIPIDTNRSILQHGVFHRTLRRNISTRFAF